MVFLYALLPVGFKCITVLAIWNFPLNRKNHTIIRRRLYGISPDKLVAVDYLSLSSLLVIEKKILYGSRRNIFIINANLFGKIISNFPSQFHERFCRAASSAVIMNGISKSFLSVSGVSTKPGFISVNSILYFISSGLSASHILIKSYFAGTIT